MTADYNGWADSPEDEREALGLQDEDELDAAWRGDMHPLDWPEDMCTPEYWLFKRDRDEGR